LRRDCQGILEASRLLEVSAPQQNNMIAKKMGSEGIVATRLSEWKIKGRIGPGTITNGIGQKDPGIL
jgi:hypothetical protein